MLPLRKCRNFRPEDWKISLLRCGEVCMTCTVEAIAVAVVKLQRSSEAVESRWGVFDGVLTASLDRVVTIKFSSAVAGQLQTGSFATVDLDHKWAKS